MRFAIRALKMPNMSFRKKKMGQDALIFYLLLLLMLKPANLEGTEMTAALKA
jgi:hypothetical protein